MHEAAQRHGRVFQVGSPNRSRRTFHRAATAVRAGRIGKLQRIQIQICAGHSDTEEIRSGDTTRQPIPDGFDYDMWLGQAPEAPYNSTRCHFNFRYNLDYSAGNIVDFGAHILDIAQWGNNSEDTGPLRVEGWGKLPQHGTYNVPTEWDLTYQYANGVLLNVRSGGYGIRFEGPDGWVAADNVNLTASHPSIIREPEPGEPHLQTCFDGEQRDFLNCVASRGIPYAPPDIEHRSMILAHIGVICMRLGRPLRWDPAAERFPDDDEATRMLGRAMRGPWRLDA
jgi:predicted dehydrogenase